MQEEIELYNKVLKEEEELVFAHISQDDLIRLGFMIHQANQGYPGPVAVLIRLNGKDVFSCYPFSIVPKRCGSIECDFFRIKITDHPIPCSRLGMMSLINKHICD